MCLVGGFVLSRLVGVLFISNLVIMIVFGGCGIFCCVWVVLLILVVACVHCGCKRWASF